MPAAPVVETSLGRLQGLVEDGCAVFRAVPYAAAPVGELRWRAPEPPKPWPGTRDGTRHGPIPLQNASDLAHYMGEFSREQGEDCLTLTISTPSLNGPRRPVLLWFHGGAFVSGAGSLDWYGGARLAAAGDIVVVQANYRLGALGWLCWPGLAEGNFGLSDQAAALRFVIQHIAAFGGDPETITLGGQSAGANTTGRLLLDAGIRPLVRRALLQSGGFGRTPSTPADARPSAAAFFDALGIQPGAPDAAARLRSVPADAILPAALKAEALGFTLPVKNQAWRPVGEGLATSQDFTRAVGEAAASAGIDLLIGYTGDEGHAFVGGPIPADPPRAAVEARFAALTGDPAALGRYEASLPGATNAQLLADLTSDYQFVRGSLEVADAAAAGGADVHAYLFDWAPARAAFGAGHCIDLAFLFGAWSSWTGAAMLGDADTVRMEALGSRLRAAVSNFVRSGDPTFDERLPWPTYDAADRRVMRFGHRIGLVRDGGGQRWL